METVIEKLRADKKIDTKVKHGVEAHNVRPINDPCLQALRSVMVEDSTVNILEQIASDTAGGSTLDGTREFLHTCT